MEEIECMAQVVDLIAEEGFLDDQIVMEDSVEVVWAL